MMFAVLYDTICIAERTYMLVCNFISLNKLSFLKKLNCVWVVYKRYIMSCTVCSELITHEIVIKLLQILLNKEMFAIANVVFTQHHFYLVIYVMH